MNSSSLGVAQPYTYSSSTYDAPNVERKPQENGSTVGGATLAVGAGALTGAGAYTGITKNGREGARAALNLVKGPERILNQGIEKARAAYSANGATVAQIDNFLNANMSKMKEFVAQGLEYSKGVLKKAGPKIAAFAAAGAAIAGGIYLAVKNFGKEKAQ